MQRTARIALILGEDSGLRADLRRLPGRPAVRAFADPRADLDALRGFAPDLLLICGDRVSERELAALRLLGQSVPDVLIAFLAAPQREVEVARLAAQVDARVLRAPCRQQDLLALLSLIHGRGSRTSPETFLDLARGISDEINNPLMFVTGHLQLLESILDPARDRSAIEQVAAMRRGLAQITETMDKIRLLSRARRLEPPLSTRPLVAMLDEAAAQARPDARAQLRLDLSDELRGVEIAADEQLLAGALRQFCAVGYELAALCTDARIVVRPVEGGIRVRLELEGLDVDDWQLPRAFEPYFLNRILRGTQHGLGLFIVQTVVHAHGGEAVAHRRVDGTVLIDLVFVV